MTTVFEKFENIKEINNEYKKIKTGTKIIKDEIKELNNNKYKKDYIEIQLIICETISSKIYFKLLDLKLSPLFNNNIPYYILFDGLYYLHRNTIITLQDSEEKNNLKEKIIAVSDPELENNNEIYSISFKRYVSKLNNEGFIISKISSFNISLKIYNIYMITRKEKQAKRRFDKKISKIKIDDDEESFQNTLNRLSKIDKIQILQDNASVSSIATNSSNIGISGLGLRNKKKDNIYEYGGFNRIKAINFIVILISLICIIIEYFVLNILQKNTYNNIIALLEYREFSKIYFQLFSSILSISCIGIQKDNKMSCLRIIENFVNHYNEENNQKVFNYTLLVMIQNKILAEQIMEKRKYFYNIRECIGNNKYSELFDVNINYSKITQNAINNRINYNATYIDTQFSEAILSICNSFQILTEGINNKIYMLSGLDDPFYFYNHNEYLKYYSLNDYQKELYEMILNYKNFYTQFYIINEELQNIIFSKSTIITGFVYFYITFDFIFLYIIGGLMYSYTICFEFILLK